MKFAARLVDARSPSQQRASWYVGPAIAAALAGYLLLDSLLTRLVGSDVGAMLAGALMVAPSVTLHRYAVGGVRLRTAAMQGIAIAVSAAFLYWAIWVWRRPPAW